MKIWVRGAAALAAATALAACGGGGEGPKTGRGEAIVRAVDPVALKLTLDHGDIPGMMKAMKMDFEVADPALLDGLAPGDEVRFAVREEAGRYTVVEIAKQPAEGAP
jgi:Cu/Ag efflux protein CusF